MTISSAQADALAARQASVKRQDGAAPLLINTEDGRLMPNAPNIRALQGYRVYHGDPKADLKTRMAYLRSDGHGKHNTPVVSADDVQPFDVSKASKEELIAFAMNEYGAALDVAADLRTMRKKVMELAEAAGSLA